MFLEIAEGIMKHNLKREPIRGYIRDVGLDSLGNEYFRQYENMKVF